MNLGDTSDQVETVSGLNRRIKALLEEGFRGVWLRGEVSNLRRQSSGHCYFSLKDAESQIAAVLFRGSAARQPIELRDGMQVLAYGEISLYEPRGTYQLIVRVINDDGAGRLQQEFERLKRKLAEEGLFAAEKKRRLPELPATVGFITSPTGAAVQDFLRILKRRRWRGRVVILPARVQGAGAAAEMIEMLRWATSKQIFDLVVIGRGGGSIEDLWAFNEEALVRAVAACPVPVISAVGHEIDFTLTDFAADARAETPSAAAELISSSFVRCDERFSLVRQSLDALAARHLSERWRALEANANHLRLLSPRQKIEQHYLRLDDLTNRLKAGLRRSLEEGERKLARMRDRLQRSSPDARVRVAAHEVKTLRERIGRAAGGQLARRSDWYRQMERRLQSASPGSVLNRGFAIVRGEDGKPISRRTEVREGERLTAEFADGSVPVQALPEEPGRD